MNDSTKRVIRTVIQAVVGLAALAPVLVSQAGLDPAALPWLAAGLAFIAAVARIMQVPAVESLLESLGIGASKPVVAPSDLPVKAPPVPPVVVAKAPDTVATGIALGDEYPPTTGY